MTSQRVGMYEVKRPTAARPGRVVFVLRWTAPDGRRMSELLGERPQMTKTMATKLQRRRQAEVDKGNDGGERPAHELGRMSVSAFLEEDLRLVSHLQPRSLDSLKVSGKHLIEVLGPGLDVVKVQAAQVDKFVKALRAKGLSEETVKKHRAYMRGCWTRGMERRRVLGNAFAVRHRALKVAEDDNGDGGAVRTYSAAQVAALIAAAPDAWWRDLIMLGAMSGLRLGESLNLRADAVLADAVKVSAKKAAPGVLPWVAKTSKSYRTVPLPQEVAAMLKRRALASDSAYLFLDAKRVARLEARVERGKGLPDRLVNNFARVWVEVLERARAACPGTWEARTYHDLRKTYLSLMAQRLPSPKDLQRLVGHSSIATTMGFYVGTEGLGERVRAALAS